MASRTATAPERDAGVALPPGVYEGTVTRFERHDAIGDRPARVGDTAYVSIDRAPRGDPEAELGAVVHLARGLVVDGDGRLADVRQHARLRVTLCPVPEGERPHPRRVRAAVLLPPPPPVAPAAADAATWLGVRERRAAVDALGAAVRARAADLPAFDRAPCIDCAFPTWAERWPYREPPHHSPLGAAAVPWCRVCAAAVQAGALDADWNERLYDMMACWEEGEIDQHGLRWTDEVPHPGGRIPTRGVFAVRGARFTLASHSPVGRSRAASCSPAVA